MGCEIVRFCFQGDDLDVVRLADGDVGVPLRRLCEALGIDAEGQRQRLNRLRDAGARWAVAFMTQATGPDGKTYEMLVLPRRSIPMWAATVDASRVADDVRPKLIAYQDEAAEVLAEHFLVRGVPPSEKPLDAAPGSGVGMGPGCAGVEGLLGGRPGLLARLAGELSQALLDGDQEGAAVLNAALSRLLPRATLARATSSPPLEQAIGRVLAVIRAENAKGRGPGKEQVIDAARIRRSVGLAAIRELLSSGLIENRSERNGWSRLWARSDKGQVQ